MSATFVIAEAGVNHNGSLPLAMQLVEIAAQAGADAVKFQTFRAERMISRFAAKAAYQARATDAHESQLDMVKKLELDAEAHAALAEHAAKCGVQFLSTPFDLDSVDLLANAVAASQVKIGSGEITNAPLLLHVARFGLGVILSTGMSSLGDIEDALGVLAFGYLSAGEVPSIADFREAYLSPEGQAKVQEKVSLLHCTTEYPTPFTDVNLKAIDTLSAAFGLPVGLSDHTQGYAVAIAAVARGATTIEKHFTLSRELPGPDHPASLEPQELAAMIRSIRQVEAALGSARKLVAPSERKNRVIARKSLVAIAPISVGDPFTAQNLGTKRPGSGISPLHYWELLGTQARREYGIDEEIVP